MDNMDPAPDGGTMDSTADTPPNMDPAPDGTMDGTADAPPSGDDDETPLPDGLMDLDNQEEDIPEEDLVDTTTWGDDGMEEDGVRMDLSGNVVDVDDSPQDVVIITLQNEQGAMLENDMLEPPCGDQLLRGCMCKNEEEEEGEEEGMEMPDDQSGA